MYESQSQHREQVKKVWYYHSLVGHSRTALYQYKMRIDVIMSVERHHTYYLFPTKPQKIVYLFAKEVLAHGHMHTCTWEKI